MTREEAILRLKNVDIRDAEQEDYDALDMAIKALEQESTTLKQLKDEIQEKGFNSPLMNPVFTMNEILEIIDKYM